MKPTITYYKGFIMFDPKDDANIEDRLYTSKFLTGHPKKPSVFYCMANNFGRDFIISHIKFFKTNFIIDDMVQDIIDNGINYVEKVKPRMIPKLNGITYKDHQVKALKFISEHKQFGIFLGPGTGKTIIGIATILMINEPGTYLVFTPIDAIKQYANELIKFLPKDFEILTSKKVPPKSDKVVYVMPYSQLHNIDPKKTYKCMLLDESHIAKNVSTNINGLLTKLKSENTYLFTGTPMDKCRHEQFAQFKILNEDLFSVKYLFYERFFFMDDYFNPTTEKRPDELAEIISSISYGEITEDVVDLPPEQEYVVPCDVGIVKPAYNQLQEHKVYIKKTWSTLADSPAKLRTKLTQLCCGFMHDDLGVVHRLPFNPKEESLVMLLGKIKQAVIYTQWDEEQVIIKEVMDKLNKSYALVNGKIKKRLNDENIAKFKQGEIDYLVIQIRKGNAALDFPHINNIIYYSLPDSYIYFKQSKYRIKRIGQSEICNYYYLIVKGSVENKRVRLLKDKKSFTDKEFSLYKKEELQ